jgi:hypothetical protein
MREMYHHVDGTLTEQIGEPQTVGDQLQAVVVSGDGLLLLVVSLHRLNGRKNIKYYLMQKLQKLQKISI